VELKLSKRVEKLILKPDIKAHRAPL